MKNLTLFFTLSVLFSSCYAPYYSGMTNYKDSVQQYQFTDIPIKQSVEKVKVFFPGENFTEEPYLKVDVIDAEGDAHISTKDLIKKLEIQAEQKGMDAIVIMGKDNISEIFPNETYGDYTVTTQKLSAIGIKYIKNIDYLDACNKTASILKWDKKENKFVEKTKIKTDWKGNFLEMESGDDFYYQFMFNFSLQHLVYEETKDWVFNEITHSPSERILKRAKVDVSGKNYYSREVEITEVNQKIVWIKVKSVYNSIFSGKIKCYYNEEKQLIQKDIESKALGAFKQKFIYEKNGRLSMVEVYDMKNEKSELYIKVVFEPFQQSELSQLLEQEQ